MDFSGLNNKPDICTGVAVTSVFGGASKPLLSGSLVSFG